MACYSDKVKAVSAKVVVGISVIILIFGLVSTILGGAQIANKVNAVAFLPELEGKIDNSGLGKMVLAFGLITIATGTVGVLTAKFKKPWFTTLFIILTFVMGLALFISGLIAAFGSEIYDAISDSICMANPGYDYYRELVDNRLCTDQCKCDESFKSVWEVQKDTEAFKEQLKRAGRGFGDLKWIKDGTEMNTWTQCY